MALVLGAWCIPSWGDDGHDSIRDGLIDMGTMAKGVQSLDRLLALAL